MGTKAKKDDADLTLREAESLLGDFFSRLQEIKAESIHLRQQRPTRSEVSETLSRWLDRQAESSGQILFNRLIDSGFLADGDNHTAPGILFAEGPVGWESQGVTAAGLIPFILPAIRGYLENWLTTIPDTELGEIPRASIDAQLAALESERQSILQRRAALQKFVRQVESAGRIPAADKKAMTLGGSLADPDFNERLEHKFFANV